jgi:hypothetical protein
MKKLLQSFVLLLAVLAIPIAAHAQVSSDVNGDGEVSIADINTVLDAILSETVSLDADVNGDGEVSLADVNVVINTIVGGSDPTPPPGPGDFGGVNAATLALLRACGMNFYSGDEPPVVEGVYAIDPVSYLANYGWDEFEDSDEEMTKIIMNFEEQEGDHVLFGVGAYYRDLDSGYQYFDTDEEQTQVSISGSGNKFTAAYCYMFENPSGFFDFIMGTAMVVSGEMTETGIRNTQFAYIVYVKDADGSIVPVFVIYGDGDGMSYPTEWPDDDDWAPAVDSATVKSLMASKMPKMVWSHILKMNRDK